MRAVIIEDETAAARNLQALLQSVVPDIEICATLESIAESVQSSLKFQRLPHSVQKISVPLESILCSVLQFGH